MPSAGQISFVYDQTRMRWMTSLTSGRFQPPLNLTEGNTIDFVFRLSNNGVLFTPALTPVWIFGIKDADDPNGDFLIQVNSATAASGVFTFVVELASAELQAWLATATSQSYAAIQITDSANDIATGPLLCQIAPNQNDSGTTPTSANGTLSVAAGKTVTFPQSLTFPSALGTNGFQLTTDGAGALTWAASGSGITIGTTTANGTAGRVLYTDGALVQQYAISGTGSVAMTNTPTLVTPVLGAATATSINGIPIYGDATALGIDMTAAGGALDTSAGGGNISTSTNGGSITTSYGGGSIDTTGTGSIQLGVTGTRTTFTGAASGTNKSIALPNLSGTVVVTAATSATATQALFATATAGAPAYRAIAAGDLPATLTSGTAITNAALTTPVLGTPSSGVMNNLTGILRGLAAQETVASYNGVALTGTMYFADATARANGTLTGIGTLFTTEAKVGDRIATASDGSFGAQGGPFFVKSIASNTSLTLSSSGNASQIGSGNAVSAKIFRSVLTSQSEAGLNLVTISADGTLILGTPPSGLSSGAFAAAGANATFNYVNLAGNRLLSSGGWIALQTYNGSARVDIGLAEAGTTNTHILTVASTFSVTGATTMTGLLTANGGITVVGGTNLLTTNTALTDQSSGNTASLGAVSNAPVPGDPTKWIAINDNGTTRYIPTWSA